MCLSPLLFLSLYHNPTATNVNARRLAEKEENVVRIAEANAEIGCERVERKDEDIEVVVFRRNNHGCFQAQIQLLMPFLFLPFLQPSPSLPSDSTVHLRATASALSTSSCVGLYSMICASEHNTSFVASGEDREKGGKKGTRGIGARTTAGEYRARARLSTQA